MNVKIYTPEGIELEMEAEYLQVMDKKSGSFAMMDFHLPTISAIEEGYVRLSLNGDDTYCYLSGGVLRNTNGKIEVACLTASLGKTAIEAETAFNSLIEIRKNQNRERNVELALAENELKKQIRKTGAGEII